MKTNKRGKLAYKGSSETQSECATGEKKRIMEIMTLLPMCSRFLVTQQ